MYFWREAVESLKIAKFVDNEEVSAFDQNAGDEFNERIDNESVKLAFFIKVFLVVLN
jgi:hypothetical protein